MKSSLLKNLGVFKKRIISNSIIYILGNFFQKALVFLLIPILTRFLTPDEYGIFGLAVTIEGILIILFGLGIQSSVTRFYFDFEHPSTSAAKYLTANFIFLIFIQILVIIFSKLFGEEVWQTITSGKIPFYPIILMIVLTASSRVIFNLVAALYQTQQNAKAFVISQASIGLLNIIFVIVFIVIYKFGVVGQLFGRLISTLFITCIVSVYFLRDWFAFPIHFNDVKKSVNYGFPLVFHGLFAWALGSIDRLMLEPHVPLAELGFYNLGYQIGGVLTALLISINQAWIPYYYSLMKNKGEYNSEKVKSILNLYIVFFGLICLLGILFSSEILSVISSPNYSKASIYVPLILFAALFNGYYFMASTPIFYNKKTSWIPIMTGLSAALNIGLNFVWIPKYGALGSAWATLISYAGLAIITYLLARHLQPFNITLWGFCILTLILFASTYLMTYIIMDFYFGLIMKIFFIAIYLLFAYFGFIKNGQINTKLYNY
jgi:O-antigen/teichoic acid export membrane protein